MYLLDNSLFTMHNNYSLCSVISFVVRCFCYHLLYSLIKHSYIYFFHYRYHCHTCKLVDGTGVCTVCAKVCHKSHEVSYSKCGSFFCDCGAKEDKSCQALVKRVSGATGSGKAATASEDSQSFAAGPFGSSTAKKAKKGTR